MALGGQIASVVIDAALNGVLPTAAGLTANATKWRDDGGSLDVQRLQTQWGPLGLTATAKLALDPQMQPMGTDGEGGRLRCDAGRDGAEPPDEPFRRHQRQGRAVIARQRA